MESQGRILVIDDSWVILQKLKARLTAQGFDVLTTTGVTAAVKLLKNVDLVIVDFHMPGEDGKAVAGILRKELGPDQSAQSATSFYLYTSDEKIAGRYAELGFDGGFLKKGDEEALVSQVDAVFRTIKMRKLAQKMKLQRGGK